MRAEKLSYVLVPSGNLTVSGNRVESPGEPARRSRFTGIDRPVTGHQTSRTILRTGLAWPRGQSHSPLFLGRAAQIPWI